MARGLSRFAARVVIALVAALVVVPLLWTLLSGFKNRVDIVTPTPMLFFTPTLDNFAYVLERESVRTGLLNSIIVSGCSVLIGAAFGLPCAYAVARYPMRFAHDIQFFVLSLRFLPPVAIAIPLIVIWLDVGLYDTRIALIVTYSLLTLATTIWLAIPAFKRVPSEIEEAAFVDGYGPYAIFFLIALPVAWKSLIGRDRVFFRARVERIPHRADADDLRRQDVAGRRFRDDPARPRRAVGHSQRFGHSAFAAAAPVPRRVKQLFEFRFETQKSRMIPMRALVLERKRVLSLRDIELPSDARPG